jgi:hypothetical protein
MPGTLNRSALEGPLLFDLITRTKNTQFISRRSLPYTARVMRSAQLASPKSAMRYVARHFLCHFLGVGKAPTDVCYDSQVLKESGVSNFELREDFYLEHRTSEQTIFEVCLCCYRPRCAHRHYTYNAQMMRWFEEQVALDGRRAAL